MACADRGALTPVIYIVKVPATCEIAHSERRMALERGKHALEPVLELRVLVDEALRALDSLRAKSVKHIAKVSSNV